MARFVEAIAWIKKDRHQQQCHGPISSFWSASILSCFQACKCCFSFIVKLSADFISLFLYSHVPRFFSILFNQIVALRQWSALNLDWIHAQLRSSCCSRTTVEAMMACMIVALKLCECLEFRWLQCFCICSNLLTIFFRFAYEISKVAFNYNC